MHKASVLSLPISQVDIIGHLLIHSILVSHDGWPGVTLVLCGLRYTWSAQSIRSHLRLNALQLHNAEPIHLDCWPLH